ncbi:NBS-containing resistance-like protein, partial [Trifolium medium]|nr:NBS-containing resistance-like protein [Trifolium medium]
NPLVLKELGCFLGGKDTRTWKRQLEKLAREPSLLKNVHDAIKVSYNDLSCVEKKVFLDVAFLSDGLMHLKVDNIRLLMNVDNIQLLLKDGGGYNLVDVLHSLKNKGLLTISQHNVKDGGGYNLVDVLHSLKNKSLLTISQHNVVSMSIIIQVMARKIIPEESKDQGKQLLEPNDK